MRRQLARGHICENQHLPDLQYFPYDFRPFSGVTPPPPALPILLGLRKAFVISGEPLVDLATRAP